MSKMLTFSSKSLLAVCILDEELSIYYDCLLRLLGCPDLLGFQNSNSAKLSFRSSHKTPTPPEREEGPVEKNSLTQSQQQRLSERRKNRKTGYIVLHTFSLPKFAIYKYFLVVLYTFSLFSLVDVNKSVSTTL